MLHITIRLMATFCFTAPQTPSFGAPVSDKPELGAALANHIATAAEKLRAQACAAGMVQVFIQTNAFAPKEPQYSCAVSIPIPDPSDDTRVLTRWALRILDHIYRPGYAYKKAGVMLSALEPLEHRQSG